MNHVQVFRSAMAGSTFNKALLLNAIFIDTALAGVNFSNTVLLKANFVRLHAPLYMEKLLHNGPKVSKHQLFHTVDTPPLKETGNSDFGQMDIVGSSWNHCQASGAGWVGWNMDRSQLEGAELVGSKWFNCLVRWSSLRNANLSHAMIFGVSFHRSHMADANLSKARLFAGEFSGTQLDDAKCIGARFDKVLFNAATMRRASFSDAHFRNCVFSKTDWKNVSFLNCEFYNVVFDNVDFSDCEHLDTAYFHKCYITNTCLGVRYDKNHATALTQTGRKEIRFVVDETITEHPRVSTHRSR